ncbi:DUF1566 domain-containing protein [Ideonella sp.]|uniref:Lcl C-terminal domain-containing protein n=1 Tax=Ideonella sp. TaxID=1929293 RepID=UPI002B459366|nr:DUF1566 domain-containing protein [Ideonella sp.]HJV71934.1 DUF1566 domain-containing protein [Ideonella sp.]
MRSAALSSFITPRAVVPVLCLAVAGAPAAEPPPEPALVVSADGAYVLNSRARLAWSRCVEGMHWNGKTCTGQPLQVDHAGAVALAAARRRADGGDWRLPRVPELQRLVSKAQRPPGLDPVLFPAAPRNWHWSGTANVDVAPVNPYNYGNITEGRSNDTAGQLAVLLGWAVNLGSGQARGDVPRPTKLPVRLVRSTD